MYGFNELPPVDAFLTFNLRSPCSRVDIFTRFLTAELLEDIWGRENDPQKWLYRTKPKNKTINKGQFSIKLIYKFLAICIRIQGLQNDPKESQHVQRPLRDAIVESIDFFRNKYPQNHWPPGATICEFLCSHYLITSAFFEKLSLNFQSIVLKLGQFVAGDEKLLRFTGNSGDIRLIITKPDRIGLWFYELCGSIANNRSYLLYTKMWRVWSQVGETSQVSKIVEDWGTIIKGSGFNNWNTNTILTMDSYYLCNTGRSYLLDNKIKFCAAVTVTVSNR